MTWVSMALHVARCVSGSARNRVNRDVTLDVIVHYSQAIQLRDKLQNGASSNRTFSRSQINRLFF